MAAGSDKHFLRTLHDTRENLAREANNLYSLEVEEIITGRCIDTQRIEHLLDGLLDFCYAPRIVSLFRKLCRYYGTLDRQAARDYIDFYQELWNSQDE